MRTTVIITVLVELANGDSFYHDWNGPSAKAIQRDVRRRYPEAKSIEFGEATNHFNWGAH